jgi:transposase
MNINITESAKIFGVSRQTIYAMQNRGEIPTEITAVAIMQYLEKENRKLNQIQERLGQYMTKEIA